MNALLLKLAFRNIFRNPLRSLVSIFSVGIGVLGIAFSEGFIENSLYQLREGNIYSGLGHFQIFKTDYDKNFYKDPTQFLFEPDEKLIAQLKSNRALLVAPRLRFSGMLTAHDRDYAIFAEAGIPSLEKKTTDFFEMIDGSYYSDNDTLKILVGEGVAKAQKIKANDWVTINTRAYSGSVNVMDFQVAGVFRSISEIYDSRAVLFTLKDAQTLMDTQKIHSFVGLLSSTPETPQFRKAVESQVKSANLTLRTWDEMADFYTKTVDLFNIQLFVLETVIFFMIFLVLNQALSTSFFERIREIAVMRALGDKTSSVFKLLSLEVLILTVLGVASGFIFTVFTFKLININGIAMPPPPNRVTGWTVFLTLTPAIYLKSVITIFVSTVAASILPIRKTVNMPIMKGLIEDT